jgi:DNA-binding CsgD family transcriptional regulator
VSIGAAHARAPGPTGAPLLVWLTPHYHSVVLVGRATERTRIERLLVAARTGGSDALLICGEPGVGKTALMRFARDRAEGMSVLEAQGVEAESELPYAGLSQLLAPALRHLDRLVPRQRDALRAALGLGAGQPADRFASYAATLSFVAVAAEERPLLAIVDDAHWLDTASAEGLAFVARRLGEDGIALLLSSRERAGPALEGAPLDSITLRGLTGADAVALLDRIAPRPVDRSVAGGLDRATEGNPLALSELVRLLSPAQLAGREPLPEPLPVGPNIERAFGSRIAALGEDTQRALLMAAADELGALETLGRALRLRGSDLGAVAGGEAAGVVLVAEGRLRFAHPLLRSAVYHRASAPARRDAHAALAAALDGVPGGTVRRAWHLARARLEPDEGVAGELEAVALDARRRAAPAAAGRTFEAAARLSQEPRPRVRRLLEAARDYHLAASSEAAIGLLAEALDVNQDPVVRADIQLLRAQVEALRRPPAETLALLVAEAERVEPHDPARAALMLAEAAMTYQMLGQPREMERHAERGFALAAESQGPHSSIAALVLGVARILRGEATTGYPLLLDARLLLQSSEPAILGLAATELAYAELYVGNYEEGGRLLNDLVARIRNQGALSALPYALLGLSFAEFFLGRWRAAYALATESQTLADDVGQPLISALSGVVIALVAGSQGRLDEAREQLGRASAVVDRGVETMIAMSAWAGGQIELGAGDYDDVIATLEPVGRDNLERGLEEPGVASWAQDLAEAYVRVGRVRDAEATLEVLERQAERTGRALAHAGAERCRGLLAADEEVEAHFRRALTWHDRVACPFERARTELCFGERLRRARRRSDARRPLRRALAGFEALAATPWIDRTSAELRATGERARRRTPETADRLTPQELQVAQVIAQGATNREAAAALFVTPKTIETHLAHVYRKLGVRSRVELARQGSNLAA